MTLVGDRLRELKLEEADLADQIDGFQGLEPLPLHLFKEDSLRSITENLRQALLSHDAGMTKRYLNLIVKRIQIEGNEVHIETNVAAMLAEGLPESKVRTANQAVLTIGNVWLPDVDSNHEHTG